MSIFGWLGRRRRKKRHAKALDDLLDRCRKCGSDKHTVQVGINSVYAFCNDCGATLWQHIDEHLHDD